MPSWAQDGGGRFLGGSGDYYVREDLLVSSLPQRRDTHRTVLRSWVSHLAFASDVLYGKSWSLARCDRAILSSTRRGLAPVAG
jgi:hypothetical protein